MTNDPESGGRVIVDASAAFDQGAGIGRYSRNILGRLIPTTPQIEWSLVRAPAQSKIPPFSIVGRDQEVLAARLRTLPFSRRRADQIWFRARLPLDVRLFAGKADLIYSPDFTAPPAGKTPRLVTVHDLAFLTHSDVASPALTRYLSRVVPQQVESARHVIVVSQATRDDVIRLLGVDSSKVTVCGNGVDERFFDAQVPTPEQRQRLGIPDRYLLMMGTIEPRKNHRNVFAALELLRERRDVTLVIGGRYGWGDDAIVDEIHRLEGEGLVRWLEFVPDADLPALYAGSDAVVYPSWTEGFGLPIVEGLAAGRPVVTGTAAALREVGGAYANYVDPSDIEGIASAMERVIEEGTSESDIARRQAWARTFSWDESANRIRSLIQHSIQKS
jgi:glycosyltransferase involved in cell wall biosynthesis